MCLFRRNSASSGTHKFHEASKASVQSKSAFGLYASGCVLALITKETGGAFFNCTPHDRLRPESRSQLRGAERRNSSQQESVLHCRPDLSVRRSQYRDQPFLTSRKLPPSATSFSSNGDGVQYFAPCSSANSRIRFSTFSRPTAFSAQYMGPPRQAGNP